MNGNQAESDVHGELHRRHLDNLYSEPERLGLATRILPASRSRVATAYRNTSNGGRDSGTFNVYGYSFAVDSTKTVDSITLPNDTNVDVLAIDVL